MKQTGHPLAGGETDTSTYLCGAWENILYWSYPLILDTAHQFYVLAAVYISTSIEIKMILKTIRVLGSYQCVDFVRMILSLSEISLLDWGHVRYVKEFIGTKNKFSTLDNCQLARLKLSLLKLAFLMGSNTIPTCSSLSTRDSCTHMYRKSFLWN